MDLKEDSIFDNEMSGVSVKTIFMLLFQLFLLTSITEVPNSSVSIFKREEVINWSGTMLDFDKKEDIRIRDNP